MKVFQNATILNYKGEPIITKGTDLKGQEVDEGELKVVNVFWIILNNAPLKTQNDSIQGMRLAEALDKAKDNGVIEIEEGVHDWIKPIAEQLTPQIFRLNGNNIYLLIKEGFDKPKQSKEEKGA